MKFELTESDMQQITDSLDGTGGILIKESELKYWIEHYVNKRVGNIPVVRYTAGGQPIIEK